MLFRSRTVRPDAKLYYLLLAEQQDPAPATGQATLTGSGEITFYVRYSGNRDAVEFAVGSAVRAVDDRIALVYTRTMEQQLESASFGLRPMTLLLTTFSAISLIIATIGQYAVIAFDMRRRNREFGVRLAMGASPGRIVGDVLRDGVTLTASGLVIGLLLSVGAAGILQSTLYGVTATSGVTYAVVFALLAGASLLACYLPARHASRIDPLATLRCD